MRSLLRNKARAAMRKKGICRMNKPRFAFRNGQIMTLPSFFAEHWREYV